MLSSESREGAGFFSPRINPEPVDRVFNWLQSKDFILISLIIIFTFYHYTASFFVRFAYDDIPLILGNPFITDWHDLTILLQGGRPVRALTLMLDYAVWGLNPTGYHLTNFILHVLASMLCFWLMKAVFQNRAAAFISAALFAMHPVHSEAVIGITHRKELLAMIFLVLAYLAYLKLGRRLAGYILSLVCFVLGMLSKQVVVALPFLLVAHEMILPQSEKSLRRRLIPLIPFFLIPALAFVIVPDFRLFSRFKPPDFADLNYAMILATSIRCFIPYLRLSFFPVHLNVDYHVEVSQSLLDPRLFMAVLAIILTSALAILYAKKRPMLSFGLAWFLINIFPVMNIIPSNFFLAERYLYIPSLGICLFVAGLFDELIRSSQEVVPPRHHASIEMLAIWILFIINCLLWINGFIFRRDLLWESLIPFSNYENGLMLVAGLAGAGIAAILFLAIRGLEIKIKRPIYWMGFLFASLYIIMALDYVLSYTLANGFLTGHYIFPEINIPEFTARWSDWVRQVAQPMSQPWYYIVKSGSFEIELANFALIALPVQVGVIFLIIVVYRKFARSNHNLAICFLVFMILGILMLAENGLRSMEWGSEVGLWKATVRENPRSVVGWNNLGRAYALRKKLADAENAFLRAHELAPKRSDILTNLGSLMLEKEDLASARLYLEKALQINPLDTRALLSLANINFQDGDYHEAIDQYYDLLRIQPNSAHAHYNLAVCFKKLGDYKKASYHALEALRIDPKNQRAKQLMISLEQAAQSSRQ